MFKRNSLLSGTLTLASAGFFSRFLGFFFRVFLSHTFGEEQIGLYQLIFPVYAFCHSLTCSGVEVAVARLVAKRIANRQQQEAIGLLYTSILFSVTSSLVLLFVLIHNSSKIAIYVLSDVRCAPMITVLAFALPFSALHSTICGYYLGLKQAGLIARSQLIEQTTRMIAIFLLCQLAPIGNSILSAVYGLVAGEICDCAFCICQYRHDNQKETASFRIHFQHNARDLLRHSIPLTSSRVSINILQGVESISIPLYLFKFGFSTTESLQTYGVLTGMALPCILFPSALTNSLSTMLLPTVAELETSKNNSSLCRLIQKTLFYGTLLGSFCCLFFVCFGKLIANLLFKSTLAGQFLQTLAWICPFLYTNNILISILNGLGKTTATFFMNIISLSIRISGIFLWIPVIGINGYLYTLLASQIFTFAASILLIVLNTNSAIRHK